jgi:hypothetical protein
MIWDHFKCELSIYIDYNTETGGAVKNRHDKCWVFVAHGCNSSSSCRAPAGKHKALSSKSRYCSHLHRKMNELCVLCGKVTLNIKTEMG